MARRYDEWPGVKYEGSSARGAMKGWHKHGVCAESLWKSKGARHGLTNARAEDATRRPLGAYLRVNHKDLVAMHAAITEVGVLYATANVHDGWDRPDKRTGHIKPDTGYAGHAFAIVAYDERGFWIQNSWGPGWGVGGLAHVTYDDWLENATDVWVARLGVPVELASGATGGAAGSVLAGSADAAQHTALRPHIIAIGNDGALRDSGPFATTPDDVETILTADFTRITGGWPKKRILLYAHGGLVAEKNAIDRVANYREALLKAHVYPLAFIWKTDLWTTIGNIVQDALGRRRAEGLFEGAKDFLLDRADDFLEPVARMVGGKSVWSEMKENATLASDAAGGAAIVAGHVRRLAASGVEVHIAAHSAGSILVAPLVDLLTSAGAPIRTCTLWAPAATVDLYDRHYHPAILDGRIAKFALYTLTDKKERDDNCKKIYNKSLLYLVAHACERQERIPLIKPDGTPLLGMAKHVEKHRALKKLINQGRVEWVQAPTAANEGEPGASKAEHHGDFDDDPATVKSTLRRIIGASAGKAEFAFPRSASSRRDRRRAMTG
jgi:hypothetical protein